MVWGVCLPLLPKLAFQLLLFLNYREWTEESSFVFFSAGQSPKALVQGSMDSGVQNMLLSLSSWPDLEIPVASLFDSS